MDEYPAATSRNQTSKWEKATTVATWLIAATAMLGTIFVVCEYREIKNQTQHLHRTLRQSYKPVGSFPREKIGDLAPAQIGCEPCGETDRFSLLFVPQLENQGSGLLVYVGHMYCVSRSRVDFRDRLIRGEAVAFEVDKLLPFGRRMPLAPGEHIGIKVVADSLPFHREYYVHTLVLYEDQDGNLFDTDLLAILPFEQVESDSFGHRQVRAAVDGVRMTERYHSVSEEQRATLIATLRAGGHDIANSLARE